MHIIDYWFSTCCLGIFVTYILYYLSVRKVPTLICNNVQLESFLRRMMPILSDRFSPSPLFLHAVLQTVFASVLRTSPKVVWDEVEDIELPDKGQVHLNWFHCEAQSKCSSSAVPIVVFLPGITGTVNSNYILQLVSQLKRINCRCVVFSYRGMGGKGLKTPKTYCACFTDDFGHIIDHIKSKHPESAVMAVGVSLGAMILVHYLAARGERSGLLAAMAISAPWNSSETTKSLLQPVHRFLFNKPIARGLVRVIDQHLHMFEGIIDAAAVRRSSTIHEFDESFTAPVFGFHSLEHYYTEATLAYKVSQIRTPLLCLNSADDPFSPGHSIPVEEIAHSDFVAMVLTDHGGHVAFMDSFWPRGETFMDRLFGQFAQIIFENRDAVQACFMNT